MDYLDLPSPDNSYYDQRHRFILDRELVFVFGSNLRGVHGAGAAKTALRDYGAIWGIGEGLQGRSYALPTKDRFIRTLGRDEIEKHVKKFIELTCNTDRFFYLTPVGTGLAGYHASVIAPLFKGVKRCWIPLSWKRYLEEPNHETQTLSG